MPDNKINHAERRKMEKYQLKIDNYGKPSKLNIVGRAADYAKSNVRIRFEREEDFNGRYRTSAHLMLEKNSGYKPKPGVLHKIDYEAKSVFSGDVPSLGKKIDVIQPKTLGGKLVKTGYRITSKTTRTALKIGWKSGLAAESGIYAIRTQHKKLVQNLSFEAKFALYRKLYQTDDDSIKATYTALEIADDVGQSIRDSAVTINQHLKQKKTAGLEKLKYKLAKSEYKIHISEDKPDKLSMNKELYKISRKVYKKKQRLLKKQLKSQKYILNDAATKPLALKLSVIPMKYAGRRLRMSVYQKLMYSGGDNDLLAAADAVYMIRRTLKRTGVSPTMQMKRYLHDKKVNHLKNNRDKKSDKLQKEENKLKNKRDLKKKKKRRRKANAKLVAQQKAKRDARRSAEKITEKFRSYIGGMIKGSAVVSFPTIFFGILIVLGIYMIFALIQSIAANSTWIAGTYTSQDQYLSEAEETYTQLAYSLNKNIMLLGTSDWRTGLKNMGIPEGQVSSDDPTIINWDDEPTELVWGRSEVFDYDPEYDFDPYKLWSFLCAYYYSTDDKGNIKFWKPKTYPSSKSTKKLIKDLFYAEYQFEFWYDNQSRWAALSPYEKYGGGKYNDSGAFYYYAEEPTKSGGEDWTYRFKPEGGAPIPELSDYMKDGYIYLKQVYEKSKWEYRIVNPNKSWHKTGYIIPDMRSEFYGWSGGGFDNTASWFYYADGNRYTRDSRYWTLPDGTKDEAWFMITPDDVHNWASDHPDNKWMTCYRKEYYWKTNCSLYYNVKQKKSFDKVIKQKLKAMDDGEERYELYLMYLNAKVGESDTPLRGNHQTFKSPLKKEMCDIILDGKILNDYGYDMQAWGEYHCAVKDLHRAVDIECNSSSRIYAGMDGTICEVDTEHDLIVIEHKNYEYWYDGDGNGKKRDTKIYYYNVALRSRKFKEGDEIKSGQWFANSFPESSCHLTDTGIGESDYVSNTGKLSSYIHIEVEFDVAGPGWYYIDPKLVFR